MTLRGETTALIIRFNRRLVAPPLSVPARDSGELFPAPRRLDDITVRSNTIAAIQRCLFTIMDCIPQESWCRWERKVCRRDTIDRTALG